MKRNKPKEIHIVSLPSRMAFNSVREGSKSFSPLTADPGGSKFDTTDLNELVWIGMDSSEEGVTVM